MNTVHLVIILPFLIVLLLITPVFSSDWVDIGWSDGGNVYSYNKVKIKKTKQNVVQVWGRVLYHNESMDKIIQWRMDNGLSVKGYDNLLYILNLLEIDCKKEMYRVLYEIDYDKNGQILYSVTPNKQDWDYIAPNSIYDKLQNIVCKKSKTTIR